LQVIAFTLSLLFLYAISILAKRLHRSGIFQRQKAGKWDKQDYGQSSPTERA
jgi:hypothetical protein